MSKKTEDIARMKLRSMSLGSFAEMVEESPLKSGLVNTAFDKEMSPLLIRRIMERMNFSNENERKFQDEYIEVLKRTVAKAQEVVSQSEESENQVRKQFEKTEEEFLKARTAYEQAQRKLESAKKALAYASNTLLEEKECLQQEVDRRKRMDKVVLMHISATLVHLERFGECRIAVSYADEPEMKKLGIVDEIFDEEQAKLVNIETNHHSLYGETTQADIRSRIAYVRMVAWYMLNDIPYELAYADKVIDNVLKDNGLI